MWHSLSSIHVDKAVFSLECHASSSGPLHAYSKDQAACGNRYLKRWTSEWEADLEARPEEDKDSSSGTVATTQFLQTMAFFKPLFKQLKRRQVSAVLEIMMALVASMLWVMGLVCCILATCPAGGSSFRKAYTDPAMKVDATASLACR